MPTLNWIGKDEVIKHNPPYHTLEKKYTFGAENSENMIIKGDNLLALKSLLPQYENKIKCIYIDPPYNTGNENWVYNDNVNSPKIKKWLGEVVAKDDLSRHDKWLCMMLPRLKLLHRLLSDDGVIFISIDDNEMANLKLLCDEVFGGGQAVTTLHVELSTTQGMKVSSAQKGNIVKNAEYILVYSKSIFNFQTSLYVSKEWDDHYSIFINPETKIRTTLLNFLKSKYPDINKDKIKQLYSFDENFRNFIHENSNNIFQDTMCSVNFDLSEEQEVELNEGKILEILKYKIFKTSTGSIRQLISLGDSLGMSDDFIPKFGLRKIRGDWWADYYKDMMNINKEGDIVFLNGKKCIRLIMDILKISTDKNSIILDSFAGSGTTAHAVLELNKKDGGNRKFILVEMEDYAENITAERVKRVINGYGKEPENSATGGDFSFYELGDRLLEENGNLNEKVSIEKIREYIYFSETKEKCEQKGSDFLGECNGVAYYLAYNKNEPTTLNIEYLAKIKKASSYVVYADACVLSEDTMMKYNITFKKIPRDIKKV